MKNAWGDEIDEAPAAVNAWGDPIHSEQPEKPGLSLAQAAFPGASRDYAPQQSAMPWTFDMRTGQPLMRERGQTEQRMVAGVGDALSLPTRAAGAVAGSLGYSGATGGIPFREALASPETGLMRPARQALGQQIAQGLAGSDNGSRTMGDYARIGLGGLGYLGASMLEDPTVLVGGAAKMAPKAIGGLARSTANPIKSIAEGADALSKRLIRRDYAPLKNHIKAGWDPQNAIKHGLYGKDTEALAEAADAKLTNFYKQQKGLIQQGAADGGRVDFQQALDETMAKIEKGPDSELWDKAPQIAEEYKRRFTRIRPLPKGATAEEAAAHEVAVKEAMTKDVADAQLFKSDVGEDAAFASKKGVPGIDENAAAKGRFAALLYGNIKDQIEKNSPAGLREINKAMSEIIPLRNAASHRAEVLGRQRVGKLTDFILGGAALAEPTTGIPAMVAKKLIDSQGFTKATVKVAEKLKSARTPAEAAFYANKLKALGMTAAEIDALRAGAEAIPSNAIPFRKVAEADNTDQRRAAR